MARVRGIDLMFLYGETPSWHMHVCGLTLLDPSTAPGGFDPDAVRSLFAGRLLSAPQFRWRVRDVALGFDSPVFVEDEHFDLDRHFHRIGVARPGGNRELGDLVGELLARKLDRSRPLWEIWLIEGLEGGRYAILTKISHALIDGVSGSDLATVLMDLDPVPAPREPAASGSPATAPSLVGGLAGAVGHLVRSPERVARYVVQAALQATVVARHLARGSAAGLPMATARSPLNGTITPRRVAAFTALPFEDVVRVKDAFGVKVNDVVLSVVSGALRTWLEARGELPDRSLVVEMPLSMRTAATKADVGTRVANAFVSLATDVEDPVERLFAIRHSALDAKALQHDLAGYKRVDLSDVPPPVLLGAVLRAISRSGFEARVPPLFSAIVSNVPGPPLDFYIAGAKVVGVHPFGPLLYGAALNLTVLTLGDRVDVGIVTCPDVVADPWGIADLLPAALAELVALTREQEARVG